MSFATDLQALKDSIIIFRNKISEKFEEYIPLNLINALNGVAPLDNAGLIPVANLPRIVNVDTADKLTTIRTINIAGDATWSIDFDGSENVSGQLTLSDTGVIANTYGDSITVPVLVVDSKGRITGVTNTTIRSASTLQTGVVRLNNTLTSSSTSEALTAAQGKILNDTKQDNLGFVPEDSANKGVANGYCDLDASGLVPAIRLPSYVDDILEYANLAAFPAVGESGKIYFAINSGGTTSKQYRWSGSTYVENFASPGTTDNVVEGAVNLYFTPARAQAAVTTITGNAGTATKLENARSISITGDATWTVNFDGSGNATAAMTFANIVTAGTGIKITYNAKGQVTGSSGLSASDIPNLDWSKLTTGKPTRLSGYGVEVGSAAAPSINFQDDPDSGLYRSSENVVGLAAGGASAGTFNSAGDLAMNGNVSGVSDERLKTDWQPLPKDIIHQIAALELSGTYLRKDQNRRQIGVGAQSLQRILPEAVADIEGTLAIIYGNAALAICVELAKHIVVLEDEIEKIKERI